jgi:hypothetical protein
MNRTAHIFAHILGRVWETAFVAGLVLIGLTAIAAAQEAAEATAAAEGAGVWGLIERLAPGWGVVVFVAVIGAINAAGKLIPDNAAGMLGMVRKIAKLVTLYVPNRP